MKRAGMLALVGVFLVGCSGQGAAAPNLSTSSPTNAPRSATPTPTPTPTTVQLYYPSGDPVLEGYPVLVDTKRLDRRLASWIETEEAVALAPGVYAAYSPAEPELTAYLDGPSDGDCAVRKKYFPRTGGSCWNGVLAGPQEPKTK